MPQFYKQCVVPIKALDGISNIDAKSINTYTVIKPDASCLKGHYPGNPVFPGVFIFEAVQQAVRQYTLTYHGRFRLSYIKTIRFLNPVLPNDRLLIHCDFVPNPEEGTLQVKAYCSKGDSEVSRMTLIYRPEVDNES